MVHSNQWKWMDNICFTFIITFYWILDIFLEIFFQKGIYVELCTWFGIKTENIKTNKWTLPKTHCMLKNYQPIFLHRKFYQNLMKQSRQVKSLKFIAIYSHKNTYKYIVFLNYILWKPEKRMKMNTIKMIEILVYLVGNKLKQQKENNIKIFL